MHDHAPEELDQSQPEPEDLSHRVEKIYNEWLQRRNGTRAKLLREHKLADHSDSTNKE